MAFATACSTRSPVSTCPNLQGTLVPSIGHLDRANRTSRCEVIGRKRRLFATRITFWSVFLVNTPISRTLGGHLALQSERPQCGEHVSEKIVPVDLVVEEKSDFSCVAKSTNLTVPFALRLLLALAGWREPSLALPLRWIERCDLVHLRPLAREAE